MLTCQKHRQTRSQSQDRLVVTTSPTTPDTDTLESFLTPTHTPFEELLVTPKAKNYAMSQSQNSSINANIDQNKLSPSSPYFPRSTGSAPSAGRTRAPAPPSPLSQIQPDTGESAARAVPTPPSSTVGTGNTVPVSPCFIHSHLDRTGTLQDWLQGSGSGTQSNARTNGTTPRSGSHMHQASSSRHPRIPGHQARQVVNQAQVPTDSSASSSRVTSPTNKYQASMSGYETDRSSVMGGSPLLDRDIIDDDDDTGSLTRQLAETAQGVREMSKQLGE